MYSVHMQSNLLSYLRNYGSYRSVNQGYDQQSIDPIETKYRSHNCRLCFDTYVTISPLKKQLDK